MFIESFIFIDPSCFKLIKGNPLFLFLFILFFFIKFCGILEVPIVYIRDWYIWYTFEKWYFADMIYWLLYWFIIIPCWSFCADETSKFSLWKKHEWYTKYRNFISIYTLIRLLSFDLCAFVNKLLIRINNC